MTFGLLPDQPWLPSDSRFVGRRLGASVISIRMDTGQHVRSAYNSEEKACRKIQGSGIVSILVKASTSTVLALTSDAAAGASQEQDTGDE
jgi:hypothetical protein